MFGLMKVSTHEGIAKELRLRLQAEKDSLGRVIERKNRSETRVAQLTIEKADVEERLRHAEAELAAVKKPSRKPAPIKVPSDPAGMKVAAKKLATRMKATGETIGSISVVGVRASAKKGAK
jgi:hypothetical protein